MAPSSLGQIFYFICTILELNIADNGQKQEKCVGTSIQTSFRYLT